MQKEKSVKDQLESEMYFKLAKQDRKVFKLNITDHGSILLTSYHILPKGGKLFSDSVVIRRWITSHLICLTKRQEVEYNSQTLQSLR